MSSATSAYAQIARPVKFFLVTTGADISGWVVDDLRTVTTLDPAASAANRDGVVTGVSASDLLKDLGRQIVVYSATIPGSPVTAIYRQVLLMDPSAATTEGYVLPPAPFYVKVFDSAGAGVRVVRTG
jgi:hypothetical protein